MDYVDDTERLDYMDGIDDRPRKHWDFTEEDIKRIEEELSKRPRVEPMKSYVVQTARGPITFY